MRGCSESGGISYQTPILKIKIEQNRIEYTCKLLKNNYACKECEDEVNLKGYLTKHQYLKSKFENEKLLNIFTCKEWEDEVNWKGYLVKHS